MAELNYSFRNLSSLGRTLPLEKRGKVGQGVKSARQVCSSDDKSRQGPTRFADVVMGMRLMNQHRITRANICIAQLALASFAQEFEIIYCQCLATQIHFVRPCIHSLVHLPHEVVRIGPPICSSQWTLKRTIGNLGEEIKQHSNPFANLSQHGIRRAQTNMLIAMIPGLPVDDPSEGYHPYGSIDLGDGFMLLHAREGKSNALRECEAEVFYDFFPTLQRGTEILVTRWAKLRLPTGQNCNSAWKELQKPLKERRTACNVKVCCPCTFVWSLCIY